MNYIKRLFWWLKALAANIAFGFPSKKLILIGVTGTDGKTTTSNMIAHILKSSGEKVDVVSTVGATVGGKTSAIGFHVTTPRFFALQKLFRQAVNAGTKYFVLEVTSHAIAQMRIWGCHFQVVALTNITNEHLDYHRSFDAYAKTKLSLINQASAAVINIDPPTFYRYRKLITNPHVWYTSVEKKADLEYSTAVKAGLKAEFNCFEKENALLAFQVARVLGLPARTIAKGLNSFPRVRGRFDYLELQDRRFLIDFAHTPNAFVQLYRAIQADLKFKRLIHVFGCAGLRDRTKRAKMGAVAAQNADLIILTEEDYRTEPITKIFNQIETGIKKINRHTKGTTYFNEPDRLEAISKAVALSQPEDLIILTGKAHEQSLARGRREYPWDEYQAIEKIMAANVPTKS